MSAILKQKLIDIANGFTKYGLWKGGGSKLSEMTDVKFTNLQANDVLTYNGSEWVNDDNLQTQIDTLNSNLINIDNNTMKCTYIGEGVNAGANERRPYYDFSQISGDGVFLVLNSNCNLISNYYKGCIVFKTYASITIIGDNNEWSIDGMVLTGIMCSWNANLYVYRML